jgi:hypothetical protein
VLAVAAGYACSSSSSSGTTTTTAKDAGSSDATVCGDAGNVCGNPCDPGNALGVGQFCNTVPDCLGNSQAHLCATLGDPNEHFCTFTCTDPDAGGEAGAPADECGANAICQCQGGQCGCYPSYCP